MKQPKQETPCIENTKFNLYRYYTTNDSITVDLYSYKVSRIDNSKRISLIRSVHCEDPETPIVHTKVI